MAVQSSFKNMVLCLMAICFVCSSLLAGVFALTKAPIENAQAAKNEAAIKAVLPECEAIEEERTVEFNGRSYAYNLAYDAQGNTVGCAINVAEGGFGGPISLKVGFTVDGKIWAVTALSHAETPGLGAKCTEASFSDQFKGFDPATGKLAVKKDGGDVDAITASTITSRAYTKAVATAVDVFYAIAGTPMPIDITTGATTTEN